ncbi:MAG TPA: class I SAM-dependent methyltransferase [Stellaceae bacterium]|nr:class I SAM-dependent methyltransferase [Stellaceae bacterium]
MSKLERYRHRGNKQVNGWLEPGAIEMIAALADAQTRLKVIGHVAEIGVHRGRLFILLALLRRAGEKAVAIDLFDLQHLNIDQSGEGDRVKLMANLLRHADTKDFLIHQGDSTQLTGAALVALAGGKFRLFSVDGGHTADITAHDLATAESALAPGGIVILDDCFNELWPDVAVGTMRYFGQPRGIVPFATGGNKVMFCHPAYAAGYRTALAGCASKTDARKFLGCEVLCLSFKSSTFAERVGGQAWWRAVRDTAPVRILRRAYRYWAPH